MMVSTEHLQMVMGSATISIFSLNIEGKITSANQMTADMTCRPVADLIGASFAGLIDSDDPAEAEALVAKVIEDGYFVSNHEATVRRPDASVRIIILSLRPLTRDGDITGVAGIANDVTELRQQRKALSAYLRMLETPDPTLLSLMVRESPGLYQRRKILTRKGFPFWAGCDSRLAKEIRHVSMHCSSGRLRQH